MTNYLFKKENEAFVLEANQDLTEEELVKASWLLGSAQISDSVEGAYVGPRREMVSSWSTNAVEIFNAAGIEAASRLERFYQATEFDPMLEVRYQSLSADMLQLEVSREEVRFISDIAAYNREEGLALSDDEVEFLADFAKKNDKLLSDVELFGFSQINSEHCRHKIFNGTFIIDDNEKSSSLFQLIKDTSKKAPAFLVSAYKDNVAFFKGGEASLFKTGGEREFFVGSSDLALSIKAETHNFPTTVEPLYGAATGSGGEIRDRMAGGRGSIPLTGSAVYMTSYTGSRKSNRDWKYQSPEEILIKASDGASDFGNKFGQPLITGSVFTYEMGEDFAYDRAVMLAGGVGVGLSEEALKDTPSNGDLLVLLGGDNYRIGLGGGAVSSVVSGSVSKDLELSAIQRANPEMQKRAFNVVRALIDEGGNPVVSIHDHGAGGHLNCFAELLEDTGGKIFADELPLGDKSLSLKELLSNESQERMGLIIPPSDFPALEKICLREKCPVYVVGEVDDSGVITVISKKDDLELALPKDVLFANPPAVTIQDQTKQEPAVRTFEIPTIPEVLNELLQLESCSCKDWLTNKVDRSVTGLVAMQQCAGPFQMPINNVAVTSVDYEGSYGIAYTQGHSSSTVLHSPTLSAKLSVAEALTNICQAPLADGLRGVVLSANWMWPAKQPGEGSTLYEAVEGLSDFAKELGIAVPTGKDSLSMTMVYPDGKKVSAPGTVVVTTASKTRRVTDLTEACLVPGESELFYINFSGFSDYPLGGSAFEQIKGYLIDRPADVEPSYFRKAFELVQSFPSFKAYHDISSGGALIALIEMAVTGDVGFDVSVPSVEFLLSEKPGALVQIGKLESESFVSLAENVGVEVVKLGSTNSDKRISVDSHLVSDCNELRAKWFSKSAFFDEMQTAKKEADARLSNVGKQPVRHKCDVEIEASYVNTHKPEAAILRTKGTNGDRELAYSLHSVGFKVTDITMEELDSLDRFNFLAFPGGFSNSDVLGAGRGWAGTFKYNPVAAAAIRNFYNRSDTLSIGVCNGCQLMGYLDEVGIDASLQHNESGKFESCFVSVQVEKSNSVMLKPLVGAELGVWVAHAEGRFEFEGSPNLALTYSYSEYPGNPNGSELNAAAVCSEDGRHLASMPHLERSVLSWQWPNREISGTYTPWWLAFRAAYDSLR